MKKQKITQQDYLKAHRKASREEEIARHGRPARFRAVHKSKKAYDRKREKAGLRNLPFSFHIKGEFYQFNLSSCIRQQNSLTAQFVSFNLSNLANIFYPPPIFTIIN
ncbi:hypothetical protein, partial [Alistipes finegoldii]|uniref:hypothetical protein n=1 Tax=Alistipes finegoldii TaxID=214856 RepID=UPI003AB8FDE7